MAVYAIGDVQGCLDPLQRLLDQIRFDGAHDRLWFTGDLVNRGPRSLDTLRFVRDLGDHAISVLGNHDLHLLAVAYGHGRLHKKDTLDGILGAHDRDELLDWLRYRPMLHHDAELGYTMVHAGLPPQWNLQQAQDCAHELQRTLRGDHHVDYFANMYGNEPDLWAESLTGWERLRYITNCFTRLRYVDADGRLALAYKGAPGTQPEGQRPWFSVPGRTSADLKVVFGHWSTLGARSTGNVFSLDSGCLWGGRLTALRLDGVPEWFNVDCQAERVPGRD